MRHRNSPAVTPPGGRERPRLVGAWLLVGLFVLSLPAVTPRIYASDEVQYFAYLRSLWFDRDVSFENEYRHFYEAGVTRTRLFRETFLEPVTETGRRINFGTLGCAVLWAPFYAAGDATAHVMRAAGMDVATDGYSHPYVAAVCYGSAVYAFLAVLLSVWAARRIVSRTAGGARWAAVLGGLGVWLGTPLLFYMYIAPPMSHACSAFAVALFVAVWLRVRERWSPAGLALLGALAALVTMVREQDAFFAAGPALDFALAAGAPYVRSRWGANTTLEGERVPRPWLGVTAAAVTFLLVFTPQALAYLSLNGRIFPSRLVSRKMTWTSPHALQVLGSPEHGLLYLDPAGGAGAGRPCGAPVARRRYTAGGGLPAADGCRAGLRGRQRRVVDGGRGLRPAPVRRSDRAARHRPGGAGRRRASDGGARRARWSGRSLRVVEHRAHRPVRRGADGPPAPRSPRTTPTRRS